MEQEFELVWLCLLRYQENTKPDLLLSDLKDHTAIDIEECEDVSVPMFVKHTEAVLDEADSMVCKFRKPKPFQILQKPLLFGLILF